MDLRGKDCWYRPLDRADPSSMAEAGSTRLLIVGSTREGAHNLAPEVRQAAKPPGALPFSGQYAVRDSDGWLLMFVEQGERQAEMAVSSREEEDEHWCMTARNWCLYLWSSARAVMEPTRLHMGDQVLLVGSEQVGTVTGVSRRDGRTVYRVWFGAGDSRSLGDESLEPFVFDETDPETWLRAGPGSHQDLALTVTYTKLSQPLTDTIYSYRSSRTVYRPYQFRPVLRMIDGGPQRLLIADEVGLGKTIEAGLVWNELDQRTDLRRVLVVCPAALVHKWQAEMDMRFDRKLVALDRPGLNDLATQLEAGDADTSLSAVVSLEMLRTSSALERMAAVQPTLDLVIVDEAHYLRNAGTRSFALGELLGDWADALVFLSATPLNLGHADLFNLMHLLRPEVFSDRSVFTDQIEPNRHLTAAAASLIDNRAEPRKVASTVRRVESSVFAGSVTRRVEYAQLVKLLERDEPLSWADVGQARRLLLDLNVLSGMLTRTRKVDVPDAKAVRDPRQIDVFWTPEEQAFYQSLLAFCRANAEWSGKPAGFVMQMPLRQAASCLPAMLDWLKERHGVAAWSDVADDEETDIEDRPEDLPDAPDPVDGDALATLMSAGLAVRGLDTKYDRFAEALRAARDQGLRQVMVFSFFRRTLAYLARRLEPDYRIRVMHGGTPMSERPEIIAAFRRGEFDILLVSEVGSEGLDFEFCNVLVNYDLPWNPMRVEQRIGRLDRFGQKNEKIFIYNFHVPGTIETDIYERLYARINVFHESIGELEPILRDTSTALTNIVLDPKLTPRERERRLAEIEVAWTDRKYDLGRLDESQGLLAGLDDLLVDGFTRDMEERGRFVGGAELRGLVEGLVARTGGKSKNLQATGELEIHGTDALAALLTSDRSGGSRMGLAQLKNHCFYSRPFSVVFDGDSAIAADHEFVGVRHPLIRAAVAQVEADRARMAKFATLRLAERGPIHPTLVLLSLMETTGLQPRLEMLPIAVSLDSMTVDDQTGDACLQALTSSTWLPGSQEHNDPARLVACLRLAQDATERIRHAREHERSLANASLVDARIASQTAAIDVKTAQAQARLDEATAKNQKTIMRMYDSRVRNLGLKRQRIAAELGGRRALAVSARPVAVALVVP